MKLKQIFSLGLILLFLICSLNLAFAEETETEENEKDELPAIIIAPDSPLYPAKRIIEDISMFLTFNKLRKAIRYVNRAETRLAEAKQMLEKNKTKYIDGLADDYEKDIEKAKENSEMARGLGENLTSVDQVVAIATSKHLEVLARVYEKVPEQAKQAIEHAMNVSAKNRERLIEKLREKHALEVVEEEIAIPEKIKEKFPKSISIAGKVIAKIEAIAEKIGKED